MVGEKNVSVSVNSDGVSVCGDPAVEEILMPAVEKPLAVPSQFTRVRVESGDPPDGAVSVPLMVEAIVDQSALSE